MTPTCPTCARRMRVDQSYEDEELVGIGSYNHAARPVHVTVYACPDCWTTSELVDTLR